MFYRRSQSTQSCSGRKTRRRPGAGEFPASIHSFGSCAESVSYWSWSPCRTSRRSGSTKCNRRRVATKSATKCATGSARDYGGRLALSQHFVGHTSSPHVVGYASSHTSSHTSSATLRPTLCRLHVVELPYSHLLTLAPFAAFCETPSAFRRSSEKSPKNSK